MKVILFFLLAVVSLQFPTEGESRATASMKRKSISYSSKRSLIDWTDQFIDSSEESGPSPSDQCRQLVANAFGTKGWRELTVALATEEQLNDPDFKIKVGFTDEEIQEILAESRAGDAMSAKTKEFFKSEAWRGLMAVQASKKELLSEAYRERWSLGEVTDAVKNSDEGGNFFETPQFKELLEQLGEEVNPRAPQLMVGMRFSVWLLEAFEEWAIFSADIDEST